MVLIEQKVQRSPSSDALIIVLDGRFEQSGPPFNSTHIEQLVKYAADSAEEAIDLTRNAIAALPDGSASELRDELIHTNIDSHRDRLERLGIDYSTSFEQANDEWLKQDPMSRDVTQRIAEQFIRANTRLARILFFFPRDESDETAAKAALVANIRQAGHFQLLKYLSFNANNLTILERYEALSMEKDKALVELEKLVFRQKALRIALDDQRKLDPNESTNVETTLAMVDHGNNIGTLAIDMALIIDDPSDERYAEHLAEARKQFENIIDTELKPPVDISGEDEARKLVRATSNLAFVYLLIAEKELAAGSNDGINTLQLFVDTFRRVLTKLEDSPKLEGEFHSELMRIRADALLLGAEVYLQHPQYRNSGTLRQMFEEAVKKTHVEVPAGEISAELFLATALQLKERTVTEETDPEDKFFLRRTDKMIERVQSLLPDASQ